MKGFLNNTSTEYENEEQKEFFLQESDNDNSDDWYSNKALFNMIMNTRYEMNSAVVNTREEMRKGFQDILLHLKEHNNHMEKIQENKDKLIDFAQRLYEAEKEIKELYSKKEGKDEATEHKYKFHNVLIGYLGWAVAVFMFLSQLGIL